jgi:hypothetical protein
MSDKVSLQNNAGSHRNAALPQYERSPHDLYTTPADPVQRLYKSRPWLAQTIVWDSSAGLGHIVKAVRDCGGEAIGTELTDHPFSKLVDDIEMGVDFLALEQPRASHLVINPPYNAADRHIAHGLKLGCTVFAIMRVNFICAKKRAFLLPYLREILMVGRTHMPPPGAVDQGQSPSIDYAWFRFEPEKKDAGDHGIRLERI